MVYTNHNLTPSYELLTYFSILLVIRLCNNSIYESQLDTLTGYELLAYFPILFTLLLFL